MSSKPPFNDDDDDDEDDRPIGNKPGGNPAFTSSRPPSSTNPFNKPAGSAPAPRPGAFGGSSAFKKDDENEDDEDDKRPAPRPASSSTFGNPSGNRPAGSNPPGSGFGSSSSGSGFGSNQPRPASTFSPQPKATSRDDEDQKKDAPPPAGGSMFGNRPSGTGGNTPAASAAPPRVSTSAPGGLSTPGGSSAPKPTFGSPAAKAPDKPADKPQEAPRTGGLFGAKKPDDKPATTKDAPKKEDDKGAAGRGFNLFNRGGAKPDDAKKDAPKTSDKPATPKNAPAKDDNKGGSSGFLGRLTNRGGTPDEKPATAKDAPRTPDKPASSPAPSSSAFGAKPATTSAPASPFGSAKPATSAPPALNAGAAKPASPKTAQPPPESTGRSFLGNLTGRFRRGEVPADGPKASAAAGGRKVPAAAPPTRIDGKQAKPLEKKNAAEVQVRHAWDRNRQLDVIGVGFVIFGLIVFFGVIAPGDPKGQDAFITSVIVRILGQFFGYGRYVMFLPALVMGGWLIYRHFGEEQRVFQVTRVIGWIAVFFALVTTFQLVELLNPAVPSLDILAKRSSLLATELRGGGIVGDRLYMLLMRAMGDYPTFVVVIGWWLIALMLAFEVTFAEITTYVQSVGSILAGIGAGYGNSRQRAIANRELKRSEVAKTAEVVVSGNAARAGLATAVALPAPSKDAKLALPANTTAAEAAGDAKKGLAVSGMFQRGTAAAAATSIAEPVKTPEPVKVEDKPAAPRNPFAAPKPADAEMTPKVEEPAKAGGSRFNPFAKRDESPKTAAQSEAKPVESIKPGDAAKPAVASGGGIFGRAKAAESPAPVASIPAETSKPADSTAKPEAARSGFNPFNRGAPKSEPDKVETAKPALPAPKPEAATPPPVTAKAPEPTANPVNTPASAIIEPAAKPGDTARMGATGPMTPMRSPFAPKPTATVPLDEEDDEDTVSTVAERTPARPIPAAAAPRLTSFGMRPPPAKPDDDDDDEEENIGPAPRPATPLARPDLSGPAAPRPSAFGSAARAPISDDDEDEEEDALPVRREEPTRTPLGASRPAFGAAASSAPPSVSTNGPKPPSLFGAKPNAPESVKTPDVEAKADDAPKPSLGANAAESIEAARPEPPKAPTSDTKPNTTEPLKTTSEAPKAADTPKPPDASPVRPPGAGLFGGPRPAANAPFSIAKPPATSDDEELDDEEDELLSLKPATPKFATPPASPFNRPASTFAPKPVPKPGLPLVDEGDEDDENEDDPPEKSAARDTQYIPLDDLPDDDPKPLSVPHRVVPQLPPQRRHSPRGPPRLSRHAPSAVSRRTNRLTVLRNRKRKPRSSNRRKRWCWSIPANPMMHQNPRLPRSRSWNLSRRKYQNLSSRPLLLLPHRLQQPEDLS